MKSCSLIIQNIIQNIVEYNILNLECNIAYCCLKFMFNSSVQFPPPTLSSPPAALDSSSLQKKEWWVPREGHRWHTRVPWEQRKIIGNSRWKSWKVRKIHIHNSYKTCEHIFTMLLRLVLLQQLLLPVPLPLSVPTHTTSASSTKHSDGWKNNFHHNHHHEHSSNSKSSSNSSSSDRLYTYSSCAHVQLHIIYMRIYKYNA